MTAAALLLAASLAAPAQPATAGADWPQWRGANRDGKSAETGLLKEWPAGGPKLVWSVKSLETVGAGYGQPSVVGDKMYLLGRESDDKDAVEYCACLNTSDGKKVWRTPLDAGTAKLSIPGWGVGPRSTPTVDGESIYALGANGDLLCLQRADGKVVWHKNLVTDFGGKIPGWGYSESPLVDGENVIVTPGKGTGMAALNKKTGATVWECKEFKDDAGYSSVVAADVGGVRQYVQQTMNAGYGVRAKDGKMLWKVGEISRRVAVIPTPVVADGYAFFTAGYGAGSECYKLLPDGEGTKAEKVYSKFKVLDNKHGGVIQLGDYVYGNRERGRTWVCYKFKEPKDEPVWEESKKLPGMGSISYADGHLYCYSESDGTLAFIKASPEGWQEDGRLKIPETTKLRKGGGTGVWPHPVIANGKLFLRDYELLYCYDLKGN